MDKEVIYVEIDKVQLLILTILVDSGADSPGTGMTLKEIASELNNNSITSIRKQLSIEKFGRCVMQNTLQVN